MKAVDKNLNIEKGFKIQYVCHMVDTGRLLAGAAD